MKRLLLACLAFAAMPIFAAPAFAQQSAPEIAFDSVPDFLKLPPGMNFGEVPSVAVNSKGHIFVFTRSNSAHGPAYAPSAAQLLEFAASGEFLGEIGKGLYAWAFAHTVRIDKDDNIWAVDKGSDMIVKFTPAGRVIWVFGRRKESADDETKPWEHVNPPLPPIDGLFRQPTDVAWDSAGNIYVADGVGNQRVAKFDKNGVFIKSWGSRGSEPGQFGTARAIAVDAQNNVYVADPRNSRIQVFDSDGNVKRQITGVGAPQALCITPGPNQVLYSSNSNVPENIDTAGEIYKLKLDGTVVGKFGRAGRLPKEFNFVNAIDCRNENTLYVGEIGNLRVQKLALH
jgi:streptogramin lyase